MCWMVAAAALQAGTALFAGAQQRDAYKANASALEQAGRDADTAASQARDAAAANEQRQRTVNRLQQGQRRVAIGASGFTSDGSQGDVLEFEVAQGELDALTIRYGGEVEAQRYIQQANQYRSAARQSRKQASSAMLGAVLNAGTTLLGAGQRAGWFGAGPEKAPAVQPVGMHGRLGPI
jgi:hypothetical protein